MKNVSLLMWECGLKHLKVLVIRNRIKVTPYVGVWIETPNGLIDLFAQSHSLCGSVD